MIDTHAHLDQEEFDADRSEVIRRAQDEGVEYIIIPAVESQFFDKILAIAEEFPNVYCAIGVHPHDENIPIGKELKIVEEYCTKDKVVAIGEIGLDYYYEYSTPEIQRIKFREQLRLAKAHDLPAIVHNREADADILRIIEQEQDGSLRGVLHCFSSPEDTLQKAIELGFHVSFTGNITFKNTKLREIVRAAPLEKIMLETDSPLMTPVPHRGKRNEPAFVKYIAEKIAEYKSISIDEVISMTSKTAKQLFNLAIFILILISSTCLLSAQTKKVPVKDTTGEELVHPYAKFIGLGFLAGTNTIVQSYKYEGGKDAEVSYEGILAVGGNITYGLFDFCVLEASYSFSENKKITKDFPTIKPYKYHVFNVTAHWIPNPYARINFFGTTGITNFYSNINDVKSSQIGINAGVGFIINLQTDFGLWNLVAEWRLDYELGSKELTLAEKNPLNPDTPILIKRQVTTFFSIPRVNLLWYPPIKKWLE